MKAAKFPVLWLLFTAARVLAVGLPVTLLAACDDGPFEDAGEKIDDTVDDAKDKIDRRN
jgi:hypothetical protein